MKTVIFSILFLTLSPLAFAEKLPEPCAGLSCTEKMTAIAEEFKAAGALDKTSVPFVASGECFHLVWNLNPETTHHGYILIDQKENDFFMGGQFSFFAPENPYSRLKVVEAQELNPSRFEDNKRLLMEQTYSYVDMNAKDPMNPWKYWLKANGNDLLVIARWGQEQRVFCKFARHQ